MIRSSRADLRQNVHRRIRAGLGCALLACAVRGPALAAADAASAPPDAAAVAASTASAASPASAASQARAPIPLTRFFRGTGVHDATLSPSGRWLALTSVNGNRRVLAIVDLTDKEPPAVIAKFEDGHVESPSWIDDDWLVFYIRDLDNLAAGQRHGTRAALIDRNGKHYRLLSGAVLAIPSSAEPAVITATTKYSLTAEPLQTSPWRLDVRSGENRSLARGAPPHALGWLFDPAGEPRVVTSLNDDQTEIYWRAPGREQWVRIARFPMLRPAFQPLFVDGAGQLYVAANDDHGFRVLQKFDFARGAPDPTPIVDTPGFDFNGQIVMDVARTKAYGVRVATDGISTVWFGARMKEVQAAVDARLPGRNNIVSCRHCDDPDVVLVDSRSDHDPGSFWIFRPTANEWKPVGRRWSSLDTARMGDVDFERIRARDGADLPVWITRPPGRPETPRPAVVLVHGGPWDQDPNWGWHMETQFLASRGYVVIQPEYRGSTGYGDAHFKAGWKQWGGAMQDDVADAVRWAASRGLIDPSRVCIAGGSYGGYAALIGPILYPGLYRCAIAWVAVTDPRLLYVADWTSDQSETSRRYTLPEMVGDRDKDAALLARASAVDRAAELKVPVLLAYGALDRRVPLQHGERMRDALRKAGNDPEWVVYRDEGHGWFNSDDAIDFWSRVERFLAKNLSAR
ncbi:MAG: S9 family peptidase [Proteobacteria bacterium]|nr:S9 family peptidase [Pseudomonadota bacterium]